MIPIEVQQKLDELDHSLDELFTYLSRFSHEELNRQPAAGGWSALMAAQHLFLAEQYSAGYVKKKLSFDPKLARTSLRTQLRSTFLGAYFISPFKRKAPTAIGDGIVEGTYQLDKMQEKWKLQRRQLREYLQELPAERYREEVYKHPFVGRLSIAGMIRFFQGHFDRHRRQIVRTLAQVQQEQLIE